MVKCYSTAAIVSIAAVIIAFYHAADFRNTVVPLLKDAVTNGHLSNKERIYLAASIMKACDVPSYQRTTL